MSDRSPPKLQDVRDLYRLKGADALQSAQVHEWHPCVATSPSQTNATDDTSSRGKRMFNFIHCDQIAASLESLDLVQGLLTHGDASVLYGPSNVGKSFFAVDLAAHIATGMSYRGRMRVDGGAAIYITLEGHRTFNNRIAALKAKGGLPPNTPLYIINSTINLLESADGEALVEDVMNHSATIRTPVRLIVIDTLSRAMAGGDESSSVDMSSVVQAVDGIKRGTGAHVMLVHHCGKDAGRGARGHSSLRAAIDTEIEISRQDGDSFTFAHVTKQRDLPCLPSMAFCLESVNLGINNHGKMVTSCTIVHNLDAASALSAKTRSKGSKLAPTPDQILALVPAFGSIQKQMLLSEITTQLGASVRGASAALNKMLLERQLFETSGKSGTRQNTVCITRDCAH